MAFKIRRGTNAERLTITPAQGELIYTTDSKKLYVGDGSTVGGVAVDQGLATTNYVDTAISNLVDGAASTLDTLKELADALGSDPNFAGNLTTALAGKADLTYVQAIETNKADIASLSTVATTGDYDDLLNKPTIPSITGLASEAYVDNKVSDLVNGATSTLDTLKELAEALGNDQNFATTVTNSLANKANVSDLSAVATSGDYTDLLNVPFTPNLENVGTNILPSTDVTYDLGSPTNRWRDLYLSNNTLYLGNDAISVDGVYGLALKQPGGGEGYGAGSVAWTDQSTLVFSFVEVAHPLYGYLEKLTKGDKIKELAPGDADFTLTVTGPLEFGPNVGGFVDVTVPVDQPKSQDNVGSNYYVYVVEFIKPVNNFNNLENSPLVANPSGWYDIDPNANKTLGAQYINGDAEVNIRPSWDRLPTVDFQFKENGNLVLPNTTIIASDADATEIRSTLPFNVETTGTVRIITDTVNNGHQWEFGDNGNLTLPAGGDIVDSNGVSVLGGGGSVQPYVEITNIPFITQNVILGAPVSITAAAAGTNATVTVVIGSGPTIDSITVANAGTGYTVGQRYKIWSYNIGGPDDASSIEFQVATVDVNGELLTVNNAVFVGVAANAPGTYTGVSIQYRPSVFDNVDTDLTLTRGYFDGLFNSVSEIEYHANNTLSPIGTLWNDDGWGNLTSIALRNYSTFESILNNANGDLTVRELVMWDTINDKYYKFDFSVWDNFNNTGAYAYTRNLITDPNYFRKTDYGAEVDIIIPDDGSGAGVGITRGNDNSIYNPYREVGYNQSTSPEGTLWNIDGWDDLTNVQTRTYSAFFAAYNGNLGNRVPGSRAVMYVPDNGKYYAVEWFNWTQGGNGGGFSYTRKEIDLTKLNEGIKFPDGTILKSAEGLGRVKLISPGSRRIEEAAGYKEVSVTGLTTISITSTASRSVVGDNQVWIDSTTTTIDEILEDFNAYGVNGTPQFSLDNVTWYNYAFGTGFDGVERGYNTVGTFTYNQGDPVYFRYNTGGQSVVWWDKADLPGGSSNFRGAVIDYHAYTGESTIIGSIHIIDDDGEEHISHQEVQSGSTDGENDDLWLVTTEGQIRYRRIDGEAKTLKIQWTARVFYGSELYD